MQSLRILYCLLVWLTVVVSLHADPLDQWTKRTSGTDTNLYGVAHGADRFVAVGQFGVILVSSNGTDWAFAQRGLNPTFYSVAYGAGLFVTVGDGGSLYTSANGVNWVAKNSHTTNTLSCVRWLQDRFMAVGDQGALVSSTNGVDWAAQNTSTLYPLTTIARGAGTFLAPGYTRFNAMPICLSPDGLTWTNYTAQFIALYDVAYYDNRFTSLGVRSRVQVSTNGTDWTLPIQAGDANYLFALTHFQDRFVAVGGPYTGGGQKIVSSPDGFTWKSHPVNVNNTGTLRAVAVGNNTVVAVGEKGLILQSDSLFRLGAGAALALGGREWILHGEAGRNYRFQYSPDLTSGAWRDLTNFTSTNDLISLRDTLPPSPTNRFYRVVTP